MLESRAAALRSLRLLRLDCGTRDEFNLLHGSRLFSRRLRELEIPHEYEEFDDGHMNTSYRYDLSLPRLARALGARS
jgi:enterochelin esterase family protein